MPPKIRFSREDVLDAAFQLTRENGLDALNARAVARRLGSSTQPLFRDFASMEEIRAEVVRMAGERYNAYIAKSAALAPTAYKGAGMAYILFARDEPQLFKLIFMRDRVQDGTFAQIDDANIDYILSTICVRTGFTRDTALRFHQHMSIYAHGLAVMIATHYIPYDENMLSHLLTEEYQAMLKLFRTEAAQA